MKKRKIIHSALGLSLTAALCLSKVFMSCFYSRATVKNCRQQILPVLEVDSAFV